MAEVWAGWRRKTVRIRHRVDRRHLLSRGIVGALLVHLGDVMFVHGWMLFFSVRVVYRREEALGPERRFPSSCVRHQRHSCEGGRSARRKMSHNDDISHAPVISPCPDT